MSEKESRPAPVKTGDVLAEKYEVERVLGAGGMGVVVSARHLQLKQRVALKFLLPDVATDSEVVARFLREAQSASTIRSEHVVRVSDVGVLPNGVPFMVMEYLEGKDLAALLADSGRLPVALAVDYILQAMEALAEAHRAGIVHRDLKPSNLFLTERADGSPLVKVLDFGISKVPKPDGESSKSLTRTAGLIGSPLYMSPEQIRNSKNVDARADIWSLGVILYELVAGTPPFFGEEVNSVLAAIVADEPLPLKQARSDAPRELETVVMKCLEKKPAARYDGVGALARALAPFGSRAAALSVERVLGVSERRPATNPIDPTSVAVSAAPTVIASAATAGAWTQRSPDAAPGKSKRIVAVALGVVALGAAGAAAFVLRAGAAAPDVPAAVAKPPRVAAPAKAAAPLDEPSPPTTAPAVTATPVVSASTSPAPSAAPPPLARRRTAPKPPAAAAATGKTASKTGKKPAVDVGTLIDERR